MDIKQFEVGMLVEHKSGVGRVTAINVENETVVVESLSADNPSTIPCHEIHYQPQLHQDCDQYY
ncbi:hypothetical protein [Enterovibrio coralii]|uniref:Uncharacterized protein n=1 Tax=Enterovibrio coralii TaxID=294935 RepID=A0A135I4U7_9GAMM|nr:hypothetical protein [Enterovibrio coralii]KXF80479.1 hypothetical protein ATN88_22305 [Enterovibrio coralii]